MTGNLTISHLEAAYMVGVLIVALESGSLDLRQRDAIIMHALLDKLAAPLNLSADVLARLEQARRRR